MNRIKTWCGNEKRYLAGAKIVRYLLTLHKVNVYLVKIKLLFLTIV